MKIREHSGCFFESAEDKNPLTRKIEFCLACYRHSYCRELPSFEITADEMATPEFVWDWHDDAFKMNIDPSEWLRSLCNWHRDVPWLILTADRQESAVDLACFEPPYVVERELKENYDNIRFFFRDVICVEWPAGYVTEFGPTNYRRAWSMATIMRAHDPIRASTWGKRGSWLHLGAKAAE